MALPTELLICVAVIWIECVTDVKGQAQWPNSSIQEVHQVLMESPEGVAVVKEKQIIHNEIREGIFISRQYSVEIMIAISDPQLLRNFDVSSVNALGNNFEITDFQVTTVCTLLGDEYFCQCEPRFAWPRETCELSQVCDSSTVGDTCGCIRGLPEDREQCQRQAFDVNVVIGVNLFSSTPEIFDFVRQYLATLNFPIAIDNSIEVVDVNFTTACTRNGTQEYQCQCEETFSWSCDSCSIYGACSNSTGQTCDCINSLPGNEICEPITSASQCPPSTAPATTTQSTAVTTPQSTTVTTPVTTTQSTTVTTPQSTTVTTPVTTTQSTTVTTPQSTTVTTPVTTTQSTTVTTTKSTTRSTIVITPVATTRSTTVTTTQSTTVTTTKSTPSTVAPREKRLSFAIGIDFDPSYNEPSSDVYKDANNAIQSQCRRHISNLISVAITEVRSGSTVVDYLVRAPSFQDTEIDAAENGILTNLSHIYPMIIDSRTSLSVEPADVFFGNKVILTCGPPPDHLNFGRDWTAEWRRDSALVLPDSQHSFSKQTEDNTQLLTVSRFFNTDTGNYECRMKDDNPNITVRQTFSRQLIAKETPLIQVRPLTRTVACEVGKEVIVSCTVQAPYTVQFTDFPEAGVSDSISHTFRISTCEIETQQFTCQERTSGFSQQIRLTLSREQFDCTNNDTFGDGLVDEEATGPCEENKVGEIIAVCRASGFWDIIRDGCILLPIHNLLQQSENLNNNSLPGFLDELSSVTVNFSREVIESPPTITAIVDILINVANITSFLFIPVTERSMEDILTTTGVLTNGSKESWISLNSNDTANVMGAQRNTPNVTSVSGRLLLSLETLTSSLTNRSFNIDTEFILLNKTTFTNTFNADINSSVGINITESDGETQSLTVITFESLDNVLPARDERNSTSTVINANVVLVRSGGTVENVTFAFDIRNDTLEQPQCVFWNFSLFQGLGGWDSEGCQLVHLLNDTVTCNCNHLTSFSILMSPFSPNDPILDFITYIGVGISMACLVICLIIEAIVLRKVKKNPTFYLRHISIVNIAVSLLAADIWFIIGAAISDAKGKNEGACSTATFFIHFFYLALFFWMLASALLLLYRIVNVFDQGGAKKSIMAVGFSLGYGPPLIIAIITIAVTAPSQQYIRENGVCWLNWNKSKALLAFVIPALVIVMINLLILPVVVYKILRSPTIRGAAHAPEKNVVVVIVRALAVLTPFFGVTWALGVGIMFEPHNRGIHITFALFNSLQGFFILLFGTLLDKKVQSEIALKSTTSASGTRSTSAGNSSSLLGFFQNRRQRRGYNVSTSNSGATNSFENS